MEIDRARVAEANREALARVLASEPWIVGVRPAGEVVPGLDRSTILHAAPPATWDAMCPLLQGGLAGAAVFEGLAGSLEEARAKGAAGELRVAAAQDHAAMAGGVGSISASLPVLVLEDRASGRRAFHFLMEGFGRSLVLGMWDDEVAERLFWFRDAFGPALDAAIGALGGIDAGALMAEALLRGDELHNRNAAATSLLAERLAEGMLRAGVEAETQLRALATLRDNPQFFVAVPLAAARLALDAADGIEGSTLVTGCGANGVECGVRISGLPGQWFTAPAERPVGVLFDGFAPGDVGPGCGDSLLVECFGLGATVLPAAPALWPAVGADAARAARIVEDARAIALGEHVRYRVPGGVGAAPAGVDAQRVLETGIRPTIDIVMVHPEPGRGAIGFGLTQPPMACFEQAVAALAEQLG